MVIIVDEKDNPIGQMPKLEAHRKAVLHRAFSVFIFNDDGKLLLQKRACSKYHSGGLWTNTCCSHPQPGQQTQLAAESRLMFEMGMKTELEYLFNFTYKSEYDNGLAEHEIDHVFIGYSNEIPQINTEEVSEWKYESVDFLRNDIRKNSCFYTSWFAIVLENFQEYIYERFQQYRLLTAANELNRHLVIR